MNEYLLVINRIYRKYQMTIIFLTKFQVFIFKLVADTGKNLSVLIQTKKRYAL